MLLEGNGIGGNDDTAFVGRLEDGGHQVGETLSHARAGLHQQVLVIGKGGAHRSGHLQLLAASLIVWQVVGNQPSGGEDVVGRGGHFPPVTGAASED